MNSYYRIQPAGMELPESSEGCYDCEQDSGVCVFEEAWQVFADRENLGYGNEIIEISAADSWDAGDVEGSRIDPGIATITRRWSWDEFAIALGFDNIDAAFDADDLDECEL